ncbi:serine/threonine-protein phosphatase 7 long form homolog [Arachis hypogaea]|uniref:serine/threonine-protein phosphatase 7 long form homolog n=1 Tax=Arachis hypogaea TaxID=3818 RepID=UPI003B22540B
MDAWCVVPNCGSVLIRDLQNVIRNLLLRKLDPLDTFNEVAAATLVLTGFQHVSRVGEMRGHSALLSALVERWRPETHTFHLPVGEVTVMLEDVSYILGHPINEEAVTGRSDSSHEFLVENCIACFGREPGPDDHVFGKLHIAWVRRCRDSEPCDTQESLERYVRAHIFCVLGTIVFPDKSTVSLNSKFLPLLRDFHRISGWSHWRRHTRNIQRSTAHFRRGLDDMGVDDFIWRPYMGVGILDVLAPHLVLCSTQSPLVSFECIEWHPTDRVRRQFGMQQLPPGPAFDLSYDHCKRLTGAQNHEWGRIYIQWVNRWTVDRYNTLQLGEEIIDFHPLPVYYDWYTQQYGIHLRLSDRVPGEQVGADEPQQQQEEPAGPHQEVPPHEQQEQVSLLIPSIMIIRFINCNQ